MKVEQALFLFHGVEQIQQRDVLGFFRKGRAALTGFYRNKPGCFQLPKSISYE